MAQLHLLCCKSGDLTLAIPLDRVIGVVETGPLTPLPYSAAFPFCAFPYSNPRGGA